MRIPPPRIGLGRNPVALSGTPIARSSTVSLLARSTTRNFDSGALLPTIRGGYFIDEIRLACSFFNEAHGVGKTGLGGIIKFKLGTGRLAFSAVPVAMWNYAPDFSVNSLMDDVGSVGPPISLGGPTGVPSVAAFRWLLPKPLYMPPGEALIGQVQRAAEGNGNFYVSDFTATLSFVGRALAPGQRAPETRFVPWVGYGEQAPSSGGSIQFGSVFKNPFNTPWNVQRLIIRGYEQATVNAEPNATPQFYQAFDTAQRISTVFIEDGSGYAITPRPVNPNLVTQIQGSEVWTFGRPVLPGGQMNMRLDYSTFSTNPLQQVSFVGHREENV